MKTNRTLTILLSNQRGSIAIMLVLTAVALVTPFIVNFTYDTQVNKMKIENIEDREKAKLNAESALKFAMVRLRLYKEAYNFLENNEAAKKSVTQEMVDTIWNFPFVYPIPTLKTMNAIQKQAIEKFEENTFIEGSLELTIKNISNRINLNMLRLSLIADAIKEAQKVQTDTNGNPTDPEEPNEEDLEFNAENQLLKVLKDSIEQEGLTDDAFFNRYNTLDLGIMVNELKFYISDPNSVEDAAGGDQNFQSATLSAKRAPLSSYSELYGLPEWPDEIVNLIKREFTVHGAIMIDLNKITDKLLRILIPDIRPEDVKEFFEYKNNPDAPVYFNSLEDFKNYMVNIASIMNETDFDERFKKYLAQGLQFGPTPTLFKIEAIGKVARATYTINAYVIIPAQPQPRQPRPDENGNLPDTTGGNSTNDTNGTNGTNGSNGTNTNGTPEQKTILLNPRIVEITVS